MRRCEILALFIAPLASGLLQGAVMGNAGAALFAIVFAYLFSGLIGLPVLAVLKRYGKHTLSAYLFAGSRAGAACGLLVGVFSGYSGFSFGSILAGLLFFAFHGFLVSFTYWLVVYQFFKQSPQVQRESTEGQNNAKSEA